MKPKILLVEDDRSIADMVQSYLTVEGYEVEHAGDGEEALRMFPLHAYALVVLDIMLPKLNGIDLLKRMRKESMVPILILSAKDGELDKALGLGFGADDYLAKPFSMIELLARVRAAIRRSTEYALLPARSESNPPIKVHELVIDIDNIAISKRGKPIQLTSKEWGIMKLLAAHPTKVFTKEQIYKSVWLDEYYGDENAINVHISRLREKIEDQPSSPAYIKTIWGIGYKLGEF